MRSLVQLPDEVLYHILAQFAPLPAHNFDFFWSPGISSKTLLPPEIFVIEQRQSGREQIQIAKTLCLTCRRLRHVFVPTVWSGFRCKSSKGFYILSESCVNKGELASYIQHLDLQLSSFHSPLSSDFVRDEMKSVWPRLASLRSLTLKITTAHPCTTWPVTELQSIPTLRTLRLRIFGDSFGSQVLVLPQLRDLFIEVHPPEVDELLPTEGSIETSRGAYHNWTKLFNEVVDVIEANCASGNLSRMSLFVHWILIHAFYKHTAQALLSNSSSSSSIKSLNLSSLRTLSRFSGTYESQMGTRPFLDATRGLPLTDLALTTYDLSLLNGTIFKELCRSFPELRRIRIKVRAPSTAVGDTGSEFGGWFANEVDFIQGLTSLRHLEAYKGPVLFQRQESVEAHHSLRVQVKGSLDRLLRSLRETGKISRTALFQWHIWSDGVYGPKEYMTLPDEGPAPLG